MNRFLAIPFILLSMISSGLAAREKPAVWIISDGADKNIKNVQGKYITDPDDISAVASYLLMSNEFDTRAIVIGGNHGECLNEKPSQQEWADTYFLKAYKADLPRLNQTLGGYQENIRFIESFIWTNPESYNPDKTYKSLNSYPSVKALFDEVETSQCTLHVLCWGMLSEPAIFVNHCLATGREDLLQKVQFISHWTSSFFHVGSMEHPEHVHNAFNDAEAAAYIKSVARSGKITFYECGAIGQYGIVEGGPKGRDFYNRFKASELGKIFATGKYVGPKQTVDDSDSATYWVLLGTQGVSLKDITPNGTSTPEVERANEKSFYDAAPHIRNELLRRATAASEK